MTTAPAPVLVRIPVGAIDASPDQNRETFDRAELEQLAASIAELGLLQPVKVRARGDRYVLVAGERRLRAVRDVLQLAEIPAVVDDSDDGSAALGTLAENLLRVDPGPLEEAAGYRRVHDVYGYAAAEIARRVGVPAERVRRRLGLLELSDETAHYLRSGQLPVGRAELMVGLDANRQHLALAAHHDGITTGGFRALVDRLSDEQSADAMFDPDAFMAVETYVVEAETAAAGDAPAVETIREAPLGIAEVAARLGVRPATVHQWQHRGRLPEPDFRVSGSPGWWASTIDGWAEETGRGGT